MDHTLNSINSFQSVDNKKNVFFGFRPDGSQFLIKINCSSTDKLSDIKSKSKYKSSVKIIFYITLILSIISWIYIIAIFDLFQKK